jgi:cytochrome c-type biogenesis protein CcmE
MKPRHLRLAVAGGVWWPWAALPRWCSTPSRATWCSSIRRPRSAPRKRRWTAPSASVVWSRKAACSATASTSISSSPTRPSPCRCATGILPDLFKEGKGVVAQGKLEGEVFVAREVLAKHDENYMPPEAAEALEEGAPGAEDEPGHAGAGRLDGHREPLMIPELGHFALWLALAVSLVMGVVPIWGSVTGREDWMALRGRWPGDVRADRRGFAASPRLRRQRLFGAVRGIALQQRTCR